MDDAGRAARRLVTSVTPDTPLGLQPDHQFSVRALLELELHGDERVVLLDDRGWTTSTHPSRDVWASTTRQDLQEAARVVVGPDEPIHGDTWEQAVEAHWRYLAGVAGRAGIAVTGSELAALPHDVVLDPALVARLSGPLAT